MIRLLDIEIEIEI